MIYVPRQLKLSSIGEKKINVSRLFKISRNTLDLWLKKERETGDYQASRARGVGTPPQINELEKFSVFVKEHSDLTQKQMVRKAPSGKHGILNPVNLMAELWGNNATQQNISYACRKLGITRKKKTYGYLERDQQQREEFLKKLAESNKKKCT